MAMITALIIPTTFAIRIATIPADPRQARETGIYHLGDQRHLITPGLQLWCIGEGAINPRANHIGKLLAEAEAGGAATPEQVEWLAAWGRTWIFGRAALVGVDADGQAVSVPRAARDLLRHWGILAE